jgi:tellurite resistance protein TerA
LCDLNKLPSAIETLSFTAAIDGSQTMNQMQSGYLKFLTNGEEVGRFNFSGSDFNNEKALMLGDIYRKNGEWRFNAVGQGFNGGLSALLKYFGGVETTQNFSNSHEKKETIQQSSITEPDVDNVKQIAKITLEKPGDSTRLNLSKGKKISKIKISLQWKSGVDLDLHAFYKTKDGKFGHVYYGNKSDSLIFNRNIVLDKDSGVGNIAGCNEENLSIKNLDSFESIVIATNIFRFLGFLNSGDNFSKYDGMVIVTTDVGDKITVPLTSKEKGRWCIIAKIDNLQVDPKIININKITENEPSAI